jgi:thiamine pyrophosphate-dependent acetolactate synthase large subunit-like protein
MAVRTTQEIIDALKESFGESPDDTQLAMLEDVSDTFTDLNERSNEDWRTRYEENDKAWRKRYTDRFSGKSDPEPDPPEDDRESPKPLTYESLFKTE